MDEILKYLQKPLSDAQKKLLRDIDVDGVEFRRRQFFPPDDVLSSEQARVVIDYNLPQRESKDVEVPWSEALERELLGRGIRMDDPADDGLRFGTLLLSNLRYADLKFGKTYTDSVLLDVIKARFGEVKPIQEALTGIPHLHAEKTEGYEECHAYLKNCVDGAGNSLVVQLGYADSLAFGILVGAVWHMLDRRYFVSLRRQLFPKST